jgi:hypothetical protein
MCIGFLHVFDKSICISVGNIHFSLFSIGCVTCKYKLAFKHPPMTIFQHCCSHIECIFFKVYNVIPSISAITGVSPQRYLWRVCVAFHIGPRIIIASMYHTYYHSLLSSQSPGPNHPGSRGYRLLNIAYWLSLVEIAALCGVTYISNRENYRMYSENAFSICSYGIHTYFIPRSDKL